MSHACCGVTVLHHTEYVVLVITANESTELWRSRAVYGDWGTAYRQHNRTSILSADHTANGAVPNKAS